MVSMGNPKAWIPYMNTKDCSQGFCSAYCPQWCYIIFPPPPPFEFPGDDDHDDSGPNFSPLVITIIGILASAFLLVSYYAIISKFCKNRDSSSSRTRRRSEGRNPNSEAQENQEPSIHEPWYVSNNGLDESLIKSITICKYKKGDCGGLIEGTDCSVCLSEFQEDQSLRLLPKCCHAFHIECIDKWLRSHSNCPLCRANIAFINHSPLPPPLQETHQNSESLSPIHRQNENADVAEEEENEVEVEVEEEVNLGGGRVESLQNLAPKNNPIRALGDLGNNSVVEGDTIIEITDDEDHQQVRRSVSMDYLTQTRNSMADMLLHENQDEDFPIRPESVAGSSKQAAESAPVVRKGSHGSRGFHRAMIKRSFSSGRFSFPRRGRGRNVVIPL